MITRSQRGHPLYHFSIGPMNVIMRRTYSNAKHIVLKCNKADCDVEAKLKPKENIIQRENSKKKRIIVKSEISGVFEIR